MTEEELMNMCLVLDENTPENTTEPKWITEGLINARGINMIAGKPAAGKTWIVYDMAVRLSLGLPIYCHETYGRQNVLLIDVESDPSVAKDRYHQMLRGYKDVDVDVTGNKVILFSPITTKDARRLDLINNQEHIQKVKDMIVAGNINVLFIDSLDMVIKGSINEQEEMVTLFHNLREIRVDTGVSIIIVHHYRKSDLFDEPDQAPAGSQVIVASLSTLIGLRKHKKTGNVQCIQAKNREGVILPNWNLKLIDTVNNGLIVAQVEHKDEDKKISKVEQAKLLIIDCIDKGKTTRPEIINHTDKENIKSRTVDDAFNALVVEGLIIRTKPRPATYAKA
ncbi:MAG: AAA family ATPase [Armatimonadota bacterium]